MQSRFVIEYRRQRANDRGMKHLAVILMIAMAAPALAQDCFADYKAKQSKPLRLHYGVARLSDCSRPAARAELDKRLRAQGWTLLTVLSIFGPEGLAERRESAGANFLRY